jgi:hypothetical protein
MQSHSIQWFYCHWGTDLIIFQEINPAISAVPVAHSLPEFFPAIERWKGISSINWTNSMGELLKGISNRNWTNSKVELRKGMSNRNWLIERVNSGREWATGTALIAGKNSGREWATGTALAISQYPMVLLSLRNWFDYLSGDQPCY